MLKLAIVCPCYNEEQCLNKSVKILANKIQELINAKLISPESYLLLVDDGSTDKTWQLIKNSTLIYPCVSAIKLTANMGHQNALYAGLMHVKNSVDCCISLDIDLQDDINQIDAMIAAFKQGNEIVLGIRNNRKNDSFFKKNTAKLFYYLIRKIGCSIEKNHADFRLMGKKSLSSLAHYQEKNLFLRGLIPQLGFTIERVYYTRQKRAQGKSKYNFIKMCSLAWSGVTSLSITPLRITFILSFFIMCSTLLYIMYATYALFVGIAVHGWASTVIPIYFLGGIQLFFIGLLGEYIGKIFNEVLDRPRYIIEEEINTKEKTTQQNSINAKKMTFNER